MHGRYWRNARGWSPQDYRLAYFDYHFFSLITCLSIFIYLDRKKDLVKLQAGEYVSLSKVECALIENQMVDQLCVYADPFHNYTVAMIVPNPKHLTLLAKEMQIPAEKDMLPEKWKELCKNKELTERVLKLVQETASKGKLERFEIPQRIVLVPEVWLPDVKPTLVTAAMKLKRKAISEYYSSEINAMYGKI